MFNVKHFYSKAKKELPFIAILLIFIVLSSRAIFHTGFFRTIDDITTVRIMYLAKELVRIDWWNTFPIRWSSELSHNYGYPLYLFYGSLSYYAGGLLMLLGQSHIVATKWVYVFPLLIGPIGFYWAARQKLDRIPTLVATCFYTLFPFRGFDTYTRGGVGEAWAMAFLPLMMGGIFLMEKNKKWGGLLFASFLFLCIISHNLSGMLIIGFSIFYGLIFHLKNKTFWLHLALGLGLGAFFWIPSLYYLPIVKVSYSNQNTGQILNFLEPFSALWKVEFPIFREAKFSGIFFYLFILGAGIFAFMKPKNKTKGFLFWGLFGLFLYLVLFLPFAFFWKLTLPISRILQFPWRDLILLSFVFPFFIGLFISFIKNVYAKVLLAIILIATSLLFLPTFKPNEYSYYYEYSAEDTGICATSWGDEYLPIWVKECPNKPPVQEVVIKGDTKSSINTKSLTDIAITVHSSKDTEVVVNKYYFPGWNIFVDGKKINVQYKFSEYGIFKGTIPAGNHTVRVLFSKTPVEYFSDFLSLLSICIFFFSVYKTAKNKRVSSSASSAKKTAMRNT